jgi:DNA replication initiation complex subunit (GINS family)
MFLKFKTKLVLIVMDIITYETVRNAHRAEKEEELQKLPDGFFESVRNWFKIKEKLKDTTSLLEVENAKKLLEDVINRRQKKIVLAALSTMRGQLPPAGLNDEERKFFDDIVNTLKSFKNDMNEKFRSFDDIAEEKVEEAKKSIEEMKPVEMENIAVKPNGKILVKILIDLPKFVGFDMQSYGPLRTGDIITLPDEVAKLLITRKAAENILD